MYIDEYGLSHPWQNDPHYKKRKGNIPFGNPTGLIIWDDFEVHSYRTFFFKKKWLVDYVQCQSTDYYVKGAYGREAICGSTKWRIRTWKNFKSLEDAIKFIKNKEWKK